MKRGKISIFIISLLFLNLSSLLAVEEIETVPLINLDELSPTFEEDKTELETMDEKKIIKKKTVDEENNSTLVRNEKIQRLIYLMLFDLT